MGVFRLYTEIVSYLMAQPNSLCVVSLDALAAVYSPYAYIGNRKSLQGAVLREAQRLQGCHAVPATTDINEIVAWWFGRHRWQTDSGAFPDFVLAWEGTDTVGDGALLELKDSHGAGIASFNSTLPSARKSLSKLTTLVVEAVRRYESCSQIGVDDRDCFYLVRTHKRNPHECRLSLVQGTFFETLPTPALLAELWGQLFAQAKVPETLRQRVIKYLAQLDRADIAQTRRVERASVKPRLRIMSEIHKEGNPHAYHEIPARSVNLVLKSPIESEQSDLMVWLEQQFVKENVPIASTSNPLRLLLGSSQVPVEIRFIQHRRNGLHLVVQAVV